MNLTKLIDDRLAEPFAITPAELRYEGRARRRVKLRYDPRRKMPPHTFELRYRPLSWYRGGKVWLLKHNWECEIFGKRLIDGITFGWSFDRHQAYVKALRPWRNCNAHH